MAKKKVEVEKNEDGEVFRFKSLKPFYYVGDLGVQFRNGEYETKDIKEAEYLRKVAEIKENK